MKTKIKPLKNYVLLKALEKETKTKSGIHLPNIEKNTDSERGIVIETGNECSKYVKVDDIVIFSLTTSTIEQAEDIYYIVREDDIVAIANYPVTK